MLLLRCPLRAALRRKISAPLYPYLVSVPGNWIDCFFLCCVQLTPGRSLLVPLIATLRSDDATARRTSKTTIGLVGKTTTLHVHLTLLPFTFLCLYVRPDLTQVSRIGCKMATDALLTCFPFFPVCVPYILMLSLKFMRFKSVTRV